MARVEIKSEISGKVWRIAAAIGSRVDADEPILIIESMKMECPVVADRSAAVVQVCVSEGDAVEEGQVLAVVEI